MYLLGTEMDYKTDKLASQFVFNNPNQAGSCGCGESVNLVPARRGEGARARRTDASRFSTAVLNEPASAACSTSVHRSTKHKLAPAHSSR